MMGRLRTSIPMVVVAAFILVCLVTGPVAGAGFCILLPWADDGESNSPGAFLILEEGPLIGNDKIEATPAEEPVDIMGTFGACEPTATAEPTLADEPQSGGSQTAGGPDFAVSNLRVPASVPEQLAYEISFDVENLGDSYAGDIRWEVEYRGAILDGFEYGAIEGLDRGQKVSITAEMMADVLVDARDEGTVSVVVDPDESTGDVDYDNNAAQEACVIIGGPEFIVSNLFAPSEIYEGGDVNILFYIRNYGSAYKVDIEWEVMIRYNDGVRDDVVLTGVLEGLGEGEEERIVADWETSPGDAGGYVISAFVTTPDDESDDNEEILDIRIVADGDLPDIALVDLQIPKTVQPGVEFPVEFTIENLGADCEEDFRYDIMYYDERTGEDIWRGDVIHGLAKGESVRITDYWTDYHEGDYSIGIYLDESNRIEELTKDNNHQRIVYHLPPGMPWLYAYGGKVPAAPPVVAGDTVPISFSVLNVGEDYDGVIDWSIRFYNDNSDEDEVSGTIEGIECDETKDVETSWEVPQGWEGEYHTVLDLNPNERPEYVFEPWQNTGLVTIIGADSEIPSGSSSTGESIPETDVCKSCAAKGEEDSDNENAYQESSVDNGDSSSGGSSAETFVSADSDDDGLSAHHSHLVEAESSELKSNMSTLESELDGVSVDQGNFTSNPVDPETNASSNSSVGESAIIEVPGDDPETDAWDAMLNALFEGDLWLFVSNLSDLLMNGTVSCAAPIGTDR
jgi:hypothetical protein